MKLIPQKLEEWG